MGAGMSAFRDNLMTCPECRSEIYADSEKCPRCGYWITSESIHRHATANRRAIRTHTRKIIKAFVWVLLALILLSLIAMIATIVEGLSRPPALPE